MNGNFEIKLQKKAEVTRSQSRRYDFTQRWDEMPFALALA